MTRYVYGGGGDAEVVSPTGLPRASAPASVYSAQTGGSVVTDVTTLGGTALGGTVTTDTFGQAIFKGPDSYTATLWLDFGSGPRWGVSPKQMDQPNAGGQLIKDQRTVDYSGRTASAKAALSTNVSVPLLNALVGQLDPLVTPRFPSSATRDAAFASPADGDTCYRTDLHCRQVYNGGIARWVSDAALIAEVVLGNSTTSLVTFSSIPQEWRNLRVVVDGRAAASTSTAKFSADLFLRLNGDSGSNYNQIGGTRITSLVGSTVTYGVSQTAGTGGSTTGSAIIPSSSTPTTSGRFGVIPGESTPSVLNTGTELLLPGYSDTSGFHQPYTGRSFGAGVTATTYLYESEWRGTWGSTAAVTSLTVMLTTNNLFQQNSTVRLYGC